MTRYFQPSDTTLRLAVHQAGPPSGQPVVFQHGLCADANQTMKLRPDAPETRWITLENRAHGHSDIGEPQYFSIDRFTSDLIDFLDRESIGPAVIGGISMGAAIALTLAARRPDLVQGLIMVRPAWIFDKAPANMSVYGRVGQLMYQYSGHDLFSRFDEDLRIQRLGHEAPANVESLRGMLNREPTSTTSALLRRISHDGPDVTRAQAARIDAPTLVIGTDKDHLHPLGHARALSEALPKARLEIAPSKSDGAEAHQNKIKELIADFLKNCLETGNKVPWE